MAVQETRLFKTANDSFIFHHEKKESHPWHYHPEYELVYIINGKGIRMVGDHIDQFQKDDLVFLGPNLSHEWKYNENYYDNSGTFEGEAIVIHFLYDSFGDNFFELSENIELKRFFSQSIEGCQIYGKTKEKIISILRKMLLMNKSQRLYALFSIFNLLSFSNEYNLLSSPSFITPFNSSNNKPIQDAIQYILQNFQQKIKASSLLEVSNMSNTVFFRLFKKTYGMSWKKYLLRIRVGYSCSLLENNSMSIAQVAYESGFENISNFNRQFKAIKKCTPSDYRIQFRSKPSSGYIQS